MDEKLAEKICPAMWQILRVGDVNEGKRRKLDNKMAGKSVREAAEAEVGRDMWDN